MTVTIASTTDTSAQVKEAGNAKLQIPMNHPAFPLAAQEMLDLGVGYTHVAPPPPAILMREMRNAVRGIHESVRRDS